MRSMTSLSVRLERTNGTAGTAVAAMAGDPTGERGPLLLLPGFGDEAYPLLGWLDEDGETCFTYFQMTPLRAELARRIQEVEALGKVREVGKLRELDALAARCQAERLILRFIGY